MSGTKHYFSAGEAARRLLGGVAAGWWSVTNVTITRSQRARRAQRPSTVESTVRVVMNTKGLSTVESAIREVPVKIHGQGVVDIGLIQ